MNVFRYLRAPALTSLAAIAIVALVGVSLAPPAPTDAANAPSPSAAPGSSPSVSSAPDETRFSHILVMIMENQRYEDVIGSADAPFINSVLEREHASATRFFTPFHNSPSDYFALSSGKGYTKGDGGDWGGTCLPSPTCSTDDVSVFQQLNEAGMSWRIYSEDQDEPCQVVNAKKYWVGHNPAVFYRNLGPNAYTDTGNGSCMTSDLPYSAFPADLAEGTVPELAFLVPNNCNNMHDKCPPLRNQIRQGDDWLAAQLMGDAVVPGGLIEWVQANDTLLIITFDESHFNDVQYCCPYAESGGGGHIPTWVVGPPGKVRAGGFQSTVDYTLYSILRTVQQNFDLPLLGHAADPAVADLIDFLPSRIELDRGAGVVGSSVALTGREFAPGEQVDILWDCREAACPDGTEIGSAVASAEGEIATLVEVPADAEEQTWAVGARGATSGLFGYAPFTIKPPLAVTPQNGAHGERVSLTGVGFDPEEPVTFYWDCDAAPCTSDQELGATESDSSGAFDAVELDVPARADKGAHTIRAVGRTSGASGVATFEVTEVLTLSPAIGIASSLVRLSGRAFEPNEEIRLIWDCRNPECGSSVTLGTATTDANGDFRDVEVTIPADAQDGDFPIGALGETRHSFARDWYKVKRPFSVFPEAGPPGKNVVISAAGFAPSEEIRVLWNCPASDCPGSTLLGAAPTDENGELSAVPFALPEGIAGGEYPVGAQGLTSGKFVATAVTVTPALRTTPARGANNWNVTARGAGFAPQQTIELFWDCDTVACAGEPVATATTDAVGGFDEVTFRVPAAARPGAHPIVARVQGGDAFTTSSFSVETWLEVSPKRGAAGWNTTLAGTGFEPGETVTLAWNCEAPDCMGGQVLETATADELGAFSIRARVPPGTAEGEYSIAAQGAESKALAVATYAVTTLVASQAAGGGTPSVSVGPARIELTPGLLGTVALAALGLVSVFLLVWRRRGEGPRELPR